MNIDIGKDDIDPALSAIVNHLFTTAAAQVLCYSSTRSSILSDRVFEYSTSRPTRSGGISEVFELDVSL